MSRALQGLKRNQVLRTHPKGYVWLQPWSRIVHEGGGALWLQSADTIHALSPQQYVRDILGRLDGNLQFKQLARTPGAARLLRELDRLGLLIALRRPIRDVLKCDSSLSRELSALAAVIPEEPDVVLSRIRSAKVAIIGLGGIGCHASLALAGAGVGHLVLADPDHVDASNLNRQVLYEFEDIGRPKGSALAERLRARRPDLKLTVLRHNVLAGGRLPEGIDHIVLAADVGPLLPSLPPHHCAVTMGGYWGSMALIGPTLSPNRGGCCFACFRSYHLARSPALTQHCQPHKTAFNSSGSAINSIAGSYVAGEVLLHIGLRDSRSPLQGQRLYVDVPTLESQKEKAGPGKCAHTLQVHKRVHPVLALNRAPKNNSTS